QAIDGFAEVDRLGIQINLLDLGVGTHHGMNSRENRSSASADLRAIGRWGLWSAYFVADAGDEAVPFLPMAFALDELGEGAAAAGAFGDDDGDAVFACVAA